MSNWLGLTPTHGPVRVAGCCGATPIYTGADAAVAPQSNATSGGESWYAGPAKFFATLVGGIVVGYVVAKYEKRVG